MLKIWHQLTWYGRLALARKIVGHLTKRLWHLLFDDRFFEWRTSRFVNAWVSWHPYIGFDFDFSIEIVPPHKGNPNDERDFSWGPEFKLGFGGPWLDFSLNIPNDDHPDNDVPIPPRYCERCGFTAESMIADRCTSCDELAVVCTCLKPQTGSASGLKLGSDVTLIRPEVDSVVRMSPKAPRSRSSMVED